MRQASRIARGNPKRERGTLGSAQGFSQSLAHASGYQNRYTYLTCDAVLNHSHQLVWVQSSSELSFGWATIRLTGQTLDQPRFLPHGVRGWRWAELECSINRLWTSGCSFESTCFEELQKTTKQEESSVRFRSCCFWFGGSTAGDDGLVNSLRGAIKNGVPK